MDYKEKLELIENGTLEIINSEELEEKFEKSKSVAYTGYEPSGKVHLGHAITVIKLKQLQDIGFKIKILLADYHAYLNGKGTMKEIQELVTYNEKAFKALGLNEDTEFIYGSTYQTTAEYSDKVYKLSTLVSLNRAKRSMDQVSRHDENPKVSSVIYPIMQVVDMMFLDVDVALGGMEQRKIQMLARENLSKIDFKPPVCIHTPLLNGLDGDEKMSSSKGNFIAIDDEENVIKKKIKKSYCPMKIIEDNPIFEIAKYFIFPNQEKILIKRSEKFGGNLELNEGELKDMYESGELHPLDLKNGVTEFLIEYLKPVREFMQR
jgi:tyrosyl-tRNA synthetase